MTRAGVAIRIFSVIALLTSATLMGAAQNPVPFINQPLVPSAIAPVSPVIAFPLTVNGTGFVPGATVNWNGSPRYTVFSSNSKLTAYILSSDIARPTTAWITVTNPSPGGGTSNTLFLPVNRPASRLAFQRQDYHVGNMPAFPTAVDLYGNGILDLAVPINDNGGGQVLFLLGNGDGTFRYGGTYQVGWGTVKPIFADFNRDGIPDMTLAVHSPGAMAVLLGQGDGTFDLPVYYPIGGAINWDVTADFNRDGKLDLATTGVSILLGNGDGTFRARVDYPTTSAAIRAEVGDFNQDGKPDLAVSVVEPGVDILLGKGDGTFQAALPFATNGVPWNPISGDFNGDGRLDIATGNFDTGTVSVLLASPSPGHFQKLD